MSDEAYVTFEQFDINKLNGSSPKTDSFVDKTGQTIKWSDISLSYNYGTNEKPMVTDLYIELPLMKARGLKDNSKETENKNGEKYTKMAFSQMLTFDMSDDDQIRALKTFQDLHSRCSHILAGTPWARENDFDPNRPGGQFKSKVYFPRDDVTKEIINGKNPTIWLDLKSGGYNRTLYTDLNGNPIDWNLLKNVNLELVPMIHVEKIRLSAKNTYKMYLASAIVTKITPAGTVSRQKTTLERLKQKYGAKLQDQVEDQLAQLRLNRQNELAAETMDSPQLPDSNTILDKGTIDRIEDVSSSETLQDFLSGPPSMSRVNLPSTQQTSLKLPSNPEGKRMTLSIN